MANNNRRFRQGGDRWRGDKIGIPRHRTQSRRSSDIQERRDEKTARQQGRRECREGEAECQS